MISINREALLAASREIKVLDGRNVQAAANYFYHRKSLCQIKYYYLTTKKRVGDQQSMLAELIFEQK